MRPDGAGPWTLESFNVAEHLTQQGVQVTEHAGDASVHPRWVRLAREQITPSLLRDWPLPSAGADKYSRGAVLVIGGARRTPGAALLAGTAALRAGAGRLTWRWRNPWRCSWP